LLIPWLWVYPEGTAQIPLSLHKAACEMEITNSKFTFFAFNSYLFRILLI